MKERRPRQGASGLATAADDRTILREIAAGDLSRFDVLVDRYKQRLFASVRRRIRDSHQAEDLVQEVFLKLFRGSAGGGYSGRGSAADCLCQMGKLAESAALLDRIRDMLPPPSEDSAWLGRLAAGHVIRGKANAAAYLVEAGRLDEAGEMLNRLNADRLQAADGRYGHRSRTGNCGPRPPSATTLRRPAVRTISSRPSPSGRRAARLPLGLPAPGAAAVQSTTTRKPPRGNAGRYVRTQRRSCLFERPWRP